MGEQESTQCDSDEKKACAVKEILRSLQKKNSLV